MITDAVIQASTIQMNITCGRFQELIKRPGADMSRVLQDAINYPPDTSIHIKDGEFVYVFLLSGHNQSMGSYEAPGCRFSMASYVSLNTENSIRLY